MMKTISLALTTLLLTACNAGYAPRYYYSTIEVANLSGKAISNVEIRVGERDLRCAEVANNALCEERFGKRPYPQQPIRISWQDGGGGQQVQEPNPSVPLTLTPALALRLVLDIQQDGSVKAHFRQEGFKF